MKAEQTIEKIRAVKSSYSDGRDANNRPCRRHVGILWKVVCNPRSRRMEDRQSAARIPALHHPFDRCVTHILGAVGILHSQCASIDRVGLRWVRVHSFTGVLFTTEWRWQYLGQI